ncbi:MAG TPA: hypothetical protein VF062_00735 [Candidatus Limnocylindrales bacterium]
MAVRVVHNATSAQSQTVAPVARSVCALLIAIGVADADLDGVMAVLADEERFPPDLVPRNMQEIAEQARLAHKMYLQDLMRLDQAVVDATIG